MLYEPEVTLALAAVGHEAHAKETQNHHRPGRGFRNGGGLQGKIDNAGVAYAGGVRPQDISDKKTARAISCETAQRQPRCRNTEIESLTVRSAGARIPIHSVTIAEGPCTVKHEARSAN